MKFRFDFVTNSSSSSFIVARKEELTELQKQKLLEIMDKKLFGKPIATTKEELDKFFIDEYRENPNDEDFDDSYYAQRYYNALKAIEKGLIIYEGTINFDMCEEFYAAFFENCWAALDKLDDDNFISIDTDLRY